MTYRSRSRGRSTGRKRRSTFKSRGRRSKRRISGYTVSRGGIRL